jgi:hypothetical protein
MFDRALMNEGDAANTEQAIMYKLAEIYMISRLLDWLSNQQWSWQLRKNAEKMWRVL